jgi:Phosphodiester glycosidase
MSIPSSTKGITNNAIALIVMIALLVFGSPVETTTAKAAVPIPAGFRLILSDVGVRVYQKDYAGGSPDYVTILDLRRGTLRNFTGNVSNNETIFPRTLGRFWTDAVAQNTYGRKAKVALNGTFFAVKDQRVPTAEGIAFGLKADWWRMSYGYAVQSEYPNLIRTLAFDSDFGSSSIQPYSRGTFDSGIPNVVGGLDPTANKDKYSNIPRTFVGVRDDNNDGHSETVIFFSSAYATQAWAVKILESFGAGSKMMLDGGGSTGLIVDGVTKINPQRQLPQVFIICAGRQ